MKFVALPQGVLLLLVEAPVRLRPTPRIYRMKIFNYLSMDICTNKYCNWIGPGNACVLAPPSRHHDGHVEAQHKGQGDQICVGGTILDDSFKGPVLWKQRR